MTALVVNGRPVVLDAPRAHLADALRDGLLLTGTHLGCEHGVCGACTVLLDGQPTRACLTYAALCEGADVRTIEGLEDDAVALRLRDAFSAEHALQCGYCTPGMLVTARDIVLRLPDVDDDRVRLELSGNLCRCTGYDGIVRAIRRVLDERLAVARPAAQPVAAVTFAALAQTTAAAPKGMAGLVQRLEFAVSPQQLWAAVRDPTVIAASIPGAELETIEGDRLRGALVLRIGPMRVRFRGEATVAYDDPAMTGRVDGGGRDGGTALTAGAAFRVEADGADSVLRVDIDYAVRGPLAQLAKPAVVAAVAGSVAGAFGEALGARLRGEAAPRPTSLARVVWRTVLGWWRR